MVQHPGVGNLCELPNPAKESTGQAGGALLLAEGGQKGARLILAWVFGPEDQEEAKIDQRDDQDGNQGC